MDLIQKLSVAALLGLTCITGTMLIQNHLSAAHSPASTVNTLVDLQKAYEERIARDTALYAAVVQFIRQKQFSQAEEKLAAIKASHPDNPQSLIHEAKLQYEQGEVAEAIHSYRLAVNKAPDYVDKTTPLFIGDEIMALISEARGKLLREKKLKPGDKSISLALEDIYYLQRRIAGGCE